MLSETATNIRMDTFDDSEVASPNTELHIYNNCAIRHVTAVKIGNQEINGEIKE
jgi:hypothetical protein